MIGEKGDILVVDGDQDVREQTAKLLVDAGYKVTTSTDGNHCLKLLERQSWKWAPRFVLIDTLLSGLSCFELLRRLNEKFENKETHIVMMSKYNAPEDEMESTNAGAAGFVVKPLSPDHLSSIISRMEEKKSRLTKLAQEIKAAGSV